MMSLGSSMSSKRSCCCQLKWVGASVFFAIMRSCTSRACTSMVMRATSFDRSSPEMGLRIMPQRFAMCLLCCFLTMRRAFLFPFSTFASEVPQSVVHLIWPEVISSCPDHSLTHFSLRTFGVMFMLWHLTRCTRSDSIIRFSTMPSQISTGPSSFTGEMHFSFSPSGATRPMHSHLRFCVGGCSSSVFTPSKHFLMCLCTCSGSFAWPRISSRSSLEMK
mmetsp:Transcript_25519/g.76015  ORF Transcript_25519/g.76015 Transcript_25519/m.76015 type:complete len:219 (+) Transcript_25519:1869-2525(+)